MLFRSIDTDAGKSYATAFLAQELKKSGKSVITQKFIQTGNVGYSEDIELHRKIMGTGLLKEDLEQLTFPEVFSYPASPLLASKIDNREINFEKIYSATKKLSDAYDIVLLEGAGGLMVPLTEDMLTIDYIVENDLPLVFVTSGKLGSVNHTLLSFEAIKSRGIKLHTVIYNLFPENGDKIILEDTKTYIKKYIEREFPDAAFIECPVIKL